jgi:hypothetical protein
LRAGFEGMPVKNFTDIASRLNKDGTFSWILDARILDARILDARILDWELTIDCFCPMR